MWGKKVKHDSYRLTAHLSWATLGTYTPLNDFCKLLETHSLQIDDSVFHFRVAISPYLGSIRNFRPYLVTFGAPSSQTHHKTHCKLDQHTMGYPSPLKVVSRKLADNIVISSSAFKRVNKLNFGARMALFNYDGNIVVWSPLPYGSHVLEALLLLTGTSSTDANSFRVTHLIVPDVEHTLAARSFKETFPEIKIVAMEDVNLGPGVSADYVVKAASGNKILDKSLLASEVGLHDSLIADNFEFVYLPAHQNRELVAFEKHAGIVFEADLLFNLQPLANEQFSPETGFAKNYNPHTGFSFLTRYLRPDSTVGRYMFNKIAKSADPGTKQGLKAIHLWNFDKMVMCHGNVIDSGAKVVFEKVFKTAV